MIDSKFGKSTLFLIIPVAILLSFGLLMIFNTSAAQIIDKSLNIDTHTALYKQLFYCFIGLGIGLLFYKIGYEKLLQMSYLALFIGTILLVLLFIPGIGQTINGARRWLGLFGFTFQPSEWIKLLIPCAYIHWAMLKEKIELIPFLKILSLFLIPITLILLQPDNGTTAIIFSLLFVLFLLTRVSFFYWALPLLVLTCAGGLIAYQMPHARDRIAVYLNPELDLKGKGHQPHQAKIAAGSGGLIGRGLGESLQKLNYLPEARNDYIAAIFAEEMGFLGVLGLIILYMLFCYGGMLVAIQSKDLGGFYLASILTFLISIQAFLNLGIVSGLLPSKGMTLPFFSQGGTSLIVNLSIVFIFLDISRKSHPELVDD